jgi:hypothetical protein
VNLARKWNVLNISSPKSAETIHSIGISSLPPQKIHFRSQNTSVNIFDTGQRAVPEDALFECCQA